MFDAMMNWHDQERFYVVEWFCNNIPAGGETVLIGFQNVNWYKKLISIVLDGLKYRSLGQPERLRVRTLEMIFNKFRINYLKLNIQDTGIAEFMIHLAHIVIEIDIKCKTTKERGEFFESNLINFISQIESNTGWTSILTDLFDEIYYYGKQTAEFYDISPEFTAELFDHDFAMATFEGPSEQAEQFVNVCLEVYAGAELDGFVE